MAITKTFYEKSPEVLDRIEKHWAATLGKSSVNHAISVDRQSPTLLVIKNELGDVLTVKVKAAR